MTFERPLVSVVIPTHNRPSCAVSTIRAVLAASPRIEVVVSDTSLEDGISASFPEPRDTRLKLLRPGQPLSVVENFNLGLEAASGEFLIFIGDDDLVSPDAVTVAEWAQRKQLEVISFSFPVLYYWPGFVSTTRWKARGATLAIEPYDGTVQTLDTHAALRHALQNLGGGVYDMPRAYAGMVSRALVDRIVARHGALFGGVSPDIYSAALISLEARNAVHIDFPVVVPGACASSTSGHSARSRHVGGLRDNSHIGAFRNLVWDDRVPEYYGVPTVWGYSLLKAVENLPKWLEQADFFRLYLKCWISNPAYRSEIWRCARYFGVRVGWLASGWGVLRALARESLRVAHVIGRRIQPAHANGGELLEDISDTEAALVALRQHRLASLVSLQLG